MNLEEFGQTLRELRKQSGLTQAELAKMFPISPELVSRWERAYEHRGRRWKPDRQAVMRLIEIFAGQLNPVSAQHWADLAGYKLGLVELEKKFPLSTQIPSHFAPLPFQANLKRLALPPVPHLFGVEKKQQQLQPLLTQAEAPWCIALDGIGGIGKTSLASALAGQLMSTDRFYDLAWVSAKQEEFLPAAGIQSINRPALDVNSLTDALLEQLIEQVPLARPANEKLALLTEMLKARSYLIVIDNLETVADYETLMPLLRRFANPTKFLLTSRHSLQAYSDIFCLSLNELDRADAFAMLRYEAEVRGLPALARASQAQLDSIYQVVGGNPLALKLVLGQTRVLPLSQVLGNLKQARGKKTDDLYTYIYWQAWHALDPVSQEVLLMMPLAQGGTFAQLTALSEFKIDQINRALEHLVDLSLVEVSGDLEQRRYRIHRLTETFLLNEVVKWQSLP